MGRFADRRHRQKNKNESSLSLSNKENKSVKKKSIQKKSLLVDEPPKKDMSSFLEGHSSCNLVSGVNGLVLRSSKVIK